MALTPFLAEIAEQPEALRRLVAFYRGDGRERLAAWRQLALGQRRAVFIGMGTSEFAAELVLPALARAGLDATTLDAGELLHYPRPLPGLPVLVSQSGESIETRRVAETLPVPRAAVAITNTPESSIGRAVGLVLPLLAGAETAITTKTYVNTLALMLLLSRALRRDQTEPALALLEQVAARLPECEPEALARAATLLAPAKAIQFLARGPSLPAAKQAALTYQEGTRTPAYALTAGAFRHGPFELVGPELRAVLYAPEGATYDLMRGMAAEIVDKGGHAVVITNRPFPLPPQQSQMLGVAPTEEEAFPILAATTQELLLDAVARARGVVAGDFRYGAKVTMRE